MSQSLYSHIHYRCSFVLDATDEEHYWADLVKEIRFWLTKSRHLDKSYEDIIFKKWFFVGGEERYGRLSIATAVEIGSGSDQQPQYWSFRFEHPDSKIGFRQWRTDIGVTCEEDKHLRFSLALSYRTMPGYIGERPPEPDISRPWLIPHLLSKTI